MTDPASDQRPATAPPRPHKFVVVVDETPECALAVRFAARRAGQAPTDRVVLLHITPPVDFVQWGSVQEMMEAEAHEAALAVLEGHAAKVVDLSGHMPEMLAKIGQSETQILEALAADKDIYALVLAAAARGDPGPLVRYFTAGAAALPCLLVIVPGGLDDDAIDRLVG